MVNHVIYTDTFFQNFHSIGKPYNGGLFWQLVGPLGQSGSICQNQYNLVFAEPGHGIPLGINFGCEPQDLIQSISSAHFLMNGSFIECFMVMVVKEPKVIEERVCFPKEIFRECRGEYKLPTSKFTVQWNPYFRKY